MARYTVTGRGHFPFDMLRYDQAWPSTSDEAAKLQRFVESTQAVRRADRGTLTVELATAKKDYHIAFERWKSFGWEPELVSEFV